MAIRKETLHPQETFSDDIYPRTSIDQVDNLELTLDKKLDKISKIFEETPFIGIDGTQYPRRYTYAVYIVDRDYNTGKPIQTIQEAPFYPQPYKSVRRNETGEIIVPNTITSSNSAVPKGFFKSSRTIKCNVSNKQINFSLDPEFATQIFSNSEEIVLSIDLSDLTLPKLKLYLTSSVRNKINNSLQLPIDNPNEDSFVVIGTNGAQKLISLTELKSLLE